MAPFETEKRGIIDNQLEQPGRFPWSDSVAIDPVSETFGNTVEDSMTARSTLARDFRFDLSNRSLDAVRAMGGTIGPERFQAFLTAYLTAFFVNGAPKNGGLHYEYGFIAKPQGAIDTFFGNPPGCDQLPDGRGIIDCKGFSAVSELLLRELAGGTLNEVGDTDVSLPFAVGNHHMVLLRSADRVMVVDNNEVTTLNVSAGELDELARLAQSRGGGGGCNGGEARPLTGPIDLGALPTLAKRVEQVREKYDMHPEARAGWFDTLGVGLHDA